MMTIAEALAALIQTMNTATNMMAQASQISALIQTATAQGRTTFTADEWATITASDAAARAQLVAAITAALTKPVVAVA